VRREFANSIKKMCRDEMTDNSLEALMASQLLPLDKNPGLRPIGGKFFEESLKKS